MNDKKKDLPKKRPRTRTSSIRIRTTPEEKRKFETLAEWNGLSVTKLITTSVIDGRDPRVKPCDPKLIEQLIRIGNNLNQIARSCNYCSKAGQTIDLLKVQIQLDQIKHQISLYAKPA